MPSYISSTFKARRLFRYLLRDDDPLWEHCGFVLASGQRQSVLRVLSDHPAMPSAIAQELGLATSSVSSLLRPLVRRNLVECANPTARKGRIYRVTETGSRVLAMVHEWKAPKG